MNDVTGCVRLALALSMGGVAGGLANGQELFDPGDEHWDIRVYGGDGRCGVDDADVRAFARDTLEQFRDDINDADRVILNTRPVLTTMTNANIQLNVSSAVNNFPGLSAALERAAQTWESVLRDDVTIVVQVDIGNFGNSFLAATGSAQAGVNYSTVRSSLIADAETFEADYMNALPASFLYVTSNGNVNVSSSSTVVVNNATRKALGLLSGTGLDAQMTFNSSFQLDTNRSNGISGFDAEEIMLHELGHVLGFVSGVDNQDFAELDTLDIFRFARTGPHDPATLADFTTFRREGRFNVSAQTDSVDSVGTTTGEFLMSDGSPNQASHWEDDAFIGFRIGTMDPTSGFNEFNTATPSDADLFAFSIIGWDILIAPVNNCLDANGDGTLGIEDVYFQASTPLDLDGDGSANALDIQCVVENVRADELAKLR